jgi:ABC-type transport system substrate-binding protein
LKQEVINVWRLGDLPTAGPYTWSYNLPNHQANLVRNLYYRGPRPHHVAGIELDMRLTLDDCYQQTVSGDIDLGCVPPNQLQYVEDTYGISRTKLVKTGRFWLRPGTCLSSIWINEHRSLFHDNPALRKALNWAVDRTAYGGGSAPGSHGRTSWRPGCPARSGGSCIRLGATSREQGSLQRGTSGA